MCMYIYIYIYIYILIFLLYFLFYYLFYWYGCELYILPKTLLNVCKNVMGEDGPWFMMVTIMK